MIDLVLQSEARRESVAVAEQMIAQAAQQQGIERDQFAIRADRGSVPMRSNPLAFLLADLGITEILTHRRTTRTRRRTSRR